MIFVLVVALAQSNLFARQEADKLDQVVIFPKNKATVYSLLNIITEQSKLLFIYDSNVIDNEKRIKLSSRQCSIREALMQIADGSNINIDVIGNHILLSKPKTSAPPEKTIELPNPEIVATIGGELVDAQTNLPIPYAIVGIVGSSVGTITNQEGAFRLVIPTDVKEKDVRFSHIGYEEQQIGWSDVKSKSLHIALVPRAVQIEEIVISASDPLKLMQEVERSRLSNYYKDAMGLTTFYREGMYYNNKFRSLTEAVFKVHKSSFRSLFGSDQVKLLKMRRLSDYKKGDTLIAKMSAGVDACLRLDLVKEMPDFLKPSKESPYRYTYIEKTIVEGRPAHIVHFEQRKEIADPLFCGNIYIDEESKAVVQIDMEIFPPRIKEATDMYVERQTSDMRLTTKKVAYTISYKQWNDKYYINHIRGDLYFKVNKRRSLFRSSELHSWFEMLSCKMDTTEVEPIKRNERLPTRTILSDTPYTYDESFWGAYNTIPLEEEITQALRHLTPKIETME